MTTITEDYVSFETAKLLKDKGFNGVCRYYYPDSHTQLISYMDCKQSDMFGPEACIAPTLQMAMKWLREEHSIIIIVEPHIFNPQEGRTTQFRFSVWVEDNYEDPYFDDPEHQLESFSTYEKTCDVAIKYCLTNLV